MRVKHGTQLRFVVTSGASVLEDRIVEAENLNGAITVASIMYNRLSMSGGVDWRHPTSGVAIKPKYTVTLIDPSDELTGDQLCDCAQLCSQEEATG